MKDLDPSDEPLDQVDEELSPSSNSPGRKDTGREPYAPGSTNYSRRDLIEAGFLTALAAFSLFASTVALSQSASGREDEDTELYIIDEPENYPDSLEINGLNTDHSQTVDIEGHSATVNIEEAGEYGIKFKYGPNTSEERLYLEPGEDKSIDLTAQ